MCKGVHKFPYKYSKDERGRFKTNKERLKSDRADYMMPYINFVY